MRQEGRCFGEGGGSDSVEQAGKGRIPYPLEDMLRVHCVQILPGEAARLPVLPPLPSSVAGKGSSPVHGEP